MNRYEVARDELALFVSWQDPTSRRWHVVARLKREQGEYRFTYTKGALASNNFTPFGRMTDLRQEYRSAELLPLFSNRVLPRSRPEYLEYLEWLALNPSNADPLVILARTGGLRSTDSLSMYPMPTKSSNGEYRVVFFCHGLRYIPDMALDRISELKAG